MDTQSLIGKTIKHIEFVENNNTYHSDDLLGDKIEMIFKTTCGYTYRYFHIEDCCEWVKVEDVIGDIEDLIGSPIKMAEVTTNTAEKDWQHQTWTFYKFATDKGYVTVRWLGESNGYYSERVDLEVTNGDELFRNGSEIK